MSPGNKSPHESAPNFLVLIRDALPEEVEVHTARIPPGANVATPVEPHEDLAPNVLARRIAQSADPAVLLEIALKVRARTIPAVPVEPHIELAMLERPLPTAQTPDDRPEEIAISLRARTILTTPVDVQTELAFIIVLMKPVTTPEDAINFERKYERSPPNSVFVANQMFVSTP